MKKWLTILLPLCILLGTAACGLGNTAVQGREEQSVSEEFVPTKESSIEISENSLVEQSGSSIRDITAALPVSVKVLEPIGIYRADISSAETAISEWLDSLGFSPAETNAESEEDRMVRMIVL